jgi:uncharacterized protein YndB with AHSA1/START domain
VFRAFTDTEVFKKWWGPKSTTCPVADIDARPGGRYHVEMVSEDGNSTYILEGEFREFREVTPPSRLVYTWVWQNGGFKGVETLVTLDFHDRDGETELVLRHDMLPGAVAHEQHGHGWSGAFDCLADLLASA